MNKTRLLRLNKYDREQYIRENLGYMKIQDLRHYATEYGIRCSDRMSKVDLMDAIVTGLSEWAETTLLQ